MSGFNLMLVGLFKKVLIADRVGPLADYILDDPVGRPTIVIMLGATLFAIQIYCDFSGYTDMARGVSRMFGIEIPLNFNFPYFSRSITEFWRRWHISLSSWLRDYLYISLGGNRGGTASTYFNLMATMVLGGLWHGAAWNFVIWGAYQGGLLCLNRVLSNVIERSEALSRMTDTRLAQFLAWAFTLYLTLLGWIIFRVTDFEKLMSATSTYVLFDGNFQIAATGLGNASPFSAVLAMGVFIVLHATGFFTRNWPDVLDKLGAPNRMLVYAIVGVLLFFGWPTGSTPFIYFQF